MSLRTVQSEVHNLILNARRLERIIRSDEFEALFLTLSAEEQDHLLSLIKRADVVEVVSWTESRLRKQVGPQSVRELRVVASQLRIVGYALMTKEMLIRAILYEQRRRIGSNGSIVFMEGCGS